MEPLGLEMPLSSVTELNQKIAQEVAQEAAILCAPVMAYGYATPFKAFPGILSTRRDTFITALADTVRSSVGWGVKKIYFLEGSSYLAPSIKEAVARYKSKLPDDFSYEVVSWQSLGAVRRFVNEQYDDLVEVFRSEALYAYLAQEILGYSMKPQITKAPDRELLTKWRKRGMDPEKLKAYAPQATLSRWSGCDTSKRLLPLLCKEIVTLISKGE